MPRKQLPRAERLGGSGDRIPIQTGEAGKSSNTRTLWPSTTWGITWFPDTTWEPGT